MSSVTPVTKGDVTYAIFVCGTPTVEAAKFFTKHSDEFQMGVFERPAGHAVKAHQHPPVDRAIHFTTEFLYFEKGKAEVTVFDEDWKEIHKQTVSGGDFLVFLRGGHAVTMLQDSRFIEVKQGPYFGDDSAKVYRS